MKTDRTEHLLIAITFLMCLAGAFLISPDQCPDEAGRQLLSDYIYRTGKLPTGDEPETMINLWGFSYALRPYLASIVGACCMKFASIFTQSQKIMLVMSRMCSVLSITGCAYFSVKSGNILFKDRRSSILLAVMICYLPQVAFIGMYQNNDALSLMAVIMELFFLLRGYKDDWSISSCIGLGISMTIAVLSYYSVYPWILLGGVFCIVACLCNERINRKAYFIASRSALVIGIVLVLSGWFFVRNAIAHNGDLLGIAYEKISRDAAMAQGVELVDYRPGYSQFATFGDFIKQWMLISCVSTIGCFGYMNVLLSKLQYLVYGISVVVLELWAIIKILLSRNCSKMILLFHVMLVTGAIATMILSVYASYYRDYQPQGRYIITAILPVFFSIAYGMDRYAGRPAKIAFISGWLGMFLWVFFGTMSTMFL